jgi:hypothetical protein
MVGKHIEGAFILLKPLCKVIKHRVDR